MGRNSVKPFESFENKYIICTICIHKYCNSLCLYTTYGTDIQTDTHMGQTYRQTHIWDRQTPKTVFMLKKILFVVGSAPE